MVPKNTSNLLQPQHEVPLRYLTKERPLPPKSIAANQCLPLRISQRTLNAILFSFLSSSNCMPTTAARFANRGRKDWKAMIPPPMIPPRWAVIPARLIPPR